MTKNLMTSLTQFVVVALSSSAFLHTGEIASSSYQGWKTYRLSNGIVSVQIAPLLGGRVIQCSLGAHNFLWANPALAGQEPPASGLGPGGTFLNWGETSSGLLPKAGMALSSGLGPLVLFWTAALII